jgi:Xaa-Pro dipeptidase
MEYAVPETELVQRRERLQRSMQASQVDAVVIVQDADLFYFTGTVQAGTLYVPSQGEPLYMVRREIGRARRESPLPRIVPLASMREMPARLAEQGYPPARRIGFELDTVPVGLFERYRKVFASCELVDATPLVRKVRAIKSPFEIDLVRKAAAHIDRIFRAACALVREGMTQIELAAELERISRLDGHPGPVRMRAFNGGMSFGHVMAGADAAIPAYVDTPLGGVGPHPFFGQGASGSKIARHEPIIVDWGGFAGGYLADQTRILCIGELPEHLARAYDDMRAVEAQMKATARPGVCWSALYEQAVALAGARGHAARFMGSEGSQVSFVGHGVGIEIDELPFLARGFDDDVLEAGMVFAFEPKVVFPGEGAVGIEDTFLVLPDGIEQLTFSDDAIAVIGG